MSNIAVIDGSLLAFRAAAAGEKRTIVATHIGSKRDKPFDNRRAFKNWLRDTNKVRADEDKKEFNVTDFEIEDIIKAIPEKQSLHIAKEIIAYIRSSCRADEIEIYLDADGDTFRHRLATVQEYKGNRKNSIKPKNLQAVKDYLVLYQGAKIISEIEADDQISIRKWDGYKITKKGGEDKIIACTFDKDDWGCLGWSFDFRKVDGKPLQTEPMWVDGLGDLKYNEKLKKCVGYGRKYFYYQVVEQDTADNYKARKLSKKEWSPQKAIEYLKDCDTDEKCLKAISDKFKEWYPEPVEYVSWDGKELKRNWLEIMEEYWALARMLRWEGDNVQLRDVLKKYGIK